MIEAVRTTTRLFYLIGGLGRGGAERQLWYLLRTLSEVGHDVQLAVWNGSRDEAFAAPIEDLGIPVHYLDEVQGRARRLMALHRLVRAHNPAYVHSYSYHLNGVAWLASLGSHATVIGSLRNAFAEEIRSAGWLRTMLGTIAPIGVVSNSASSIDRSRLLQRWLAPSRIIVVPNAVDLSRFRASDPPPAPPVQIAGVGRLYPQKRWDVLLKALERLRQRSSVPFECRIFGDGPLLDDLLRLRDVTGLRDVVKFETATSHPEEVLAASHVLVLTSDFEGMPNVVLEAMACARPVIASDVGDLSRLIDDGECGFIVPPRDADATAMALLRLVDDANLRWRMGVAARRRVEGDHSCERLVQLTLAAYRVFERPVSGSR